MSSYRIYFKDSNRCLKSVNVLARLRYRNVNGQTGVGPSWNSTYETPKDNFCFPPDGSQQNTSEVVPLVETLIPGRLYNFAVIMERAVDTQKVTFTGIDFPGDFDPET